MRGVWVSVRKLPISNTLGESCLVTAYRMVTGVVPGGFVEGLEKDFAKYHEAKYAVAVDNTTVGLMLSYLFLEISLGSYFVLPAYTFIAAINAGIVHGLIPVFVDIDCESLNIDVNHLVA